MERAEFTTEERRQRGRTEKRMRFDSAGWGVTSAAAGVRVDSGAQQQSGEPEERPPRVVGQTRES
jgi:hypothetical protein